MSNSSKKKQFGMNIGSASILLVFVILCLVSFAVLSIVSANADSSPFHGRSTPSEGIGTKPDECDHRKCTGPVRRQYEVGRRTEDMQRGSLMNIKMPQANNVCGILYAVVL